MATGSTSPVSPVPATVRVAPASRGASNLQAGDLLRLKPGAASTSGWMLESLDGEPVLSLLQPPLDDLSPGDELLVRVVSVGARLALELVERRTTGESNAGRYVDASSLSEETRDGRGDRSNIHGGGGSTSRTDIGPGSPIGRRNGSDPANLRIEARPSASEGMDERDTTDVSATASGRARAQARASASPADPAAHVVPAPRYLRGDSTWAQLSSLRADLAGWRRQMLADPGLATRSLNTPQLMQAWAEALAQGRPPTGPSGEPFWLLPQPYWLRHERDADTPRRQTPPDPEADEEPALSLLFKWKDAAVGVQLQGPRHALRLTLLAETEQVLTALRSELPALVAALVRAGVRLQRLGWRQQALWVPVDPFPELRADPGLMSAAAELMLALR